MESPIMVKNCTNFDMPVDVNVETGFPFDDNENETPDNLQERLNNLAQRHPELASHLRFDDFPSLRRKRNNFGRSATEQDDNNSRFGAGPSSRFGDFSRFPFTSHFEDEFANEPPQSRQEKPPEVPKSQERQGRKPNPNLPQHLSNTVDLGQKQAPEEVRNQRSMSAPPENRSAHGSTRVENETSQEQHPDMGKTQSQQPEGARESTPTQPKERIIPIHVEGRDEVIFPKNTHTPHQTNSGVPPEKGFGGAAGFQQQPQFQRGTDPFAQQRWQQYDQFMPHGQTKQQQGAFNRQQTPPRQQVPPTQQHYYQQAPPQQQQPHFQQAPPQQHHHQQQAPPQQHHQQQAPPQQHHQQQAPPQQHHPQAPPQQHQQQAPPQHQTTPPPQQHRSQSTPPPSNDPLVKITVVKNDVLELMMNVENFVGTRKDREYLYLDEMLTRNLIKLDDIDTDGKDNIRIARKEAIKCIQTCLSNLEAKAQARERELKAADGQQNQTAVALIAQEPQTVEKQMSAAPFYKSEVSINLSGEAPTNQEEQVSKDFIAVEPKPATTPQISAETEAPIHSDIVSPMEVDTTEFVEVQRTGQESEPVQSNSSQPETTASK